VYNIHAGKDLEGRDNLRRIADIIVAHRPDLVLLQEVDRNTERSGNVDQLAVLAQLTGFHSAFGRTLFYQGGEYGIAILSRWPVTADTLHSLPVAPPQPRAGGSYEPRGALHAVIEAPTGSIQLLNTHLDASPADDYRLQEVDALKQLLSRLAGGGAVVLGGDFNATPESVVLQRVSEGEWRDAWELCGQGAGFTYPAKAPATRIDYLVLPGSLECDAGRVIPTKASDHLPILFVLRAAN
jgi:endonuclease/exonuclease/phosphatase family metal-dependent hydrolase